MLFVVCCLSLFVVRGLLWWFLFVVDSCSWLVVGCLLFVDVCVWSIVVRCCLSLPVMCCSFVSFVVCR